MKYFFLALIISLLSPNPIRAATTSPWTGNCVAQVELNLGLGKALYDIPTLSGIECIVRNFLSIAISAIGLSAFIMLLVGAFTFLLSGGNPKMTDAGKKTITFAILGIVVAISGWIVLAILSQFTGVTSILQFKIYQ